VRVLVQIQYFDLVELDVQVLVDRLEDTADADVVFEFDGDGLVGKGLKKTAKELMSIHRPQFSRSESVPEEEHGGSGDPGKRRGRKGEKTCARKE
jgi:hypothetical protein